jgi:LL-diaminopimelate aminotransferase
VISLGIGDPDLPTPEPVIRALREAAADPTMQQYRQTEGLEPFRGAIAAFYKERFGVEVNPDTEVVPVLGGKEGVAHIAFACLDPGDVALAPEPGYPPYTSGPLFAGGEVHYLPLEAENEFMPDLDAVPEDDGGAGQPALPELPEQPDGAVVAAGFFDRAVEFARAHDIIVVHDNAYSEIVFDGYEAPSFLATSGATEVGVEIFSLSKGWNMTGWRVGWVAGNAEVVEHFRRLKTNLDSGMFDALQVAGAPR